MVSVTSASYYIMSASSYHPLIQSRSSMYIRGLIPRNFAELAEEVPIRAYSSYHICKNAFAYTFEPNTWDYYIPVLKVS